MNVERIDDISLWSAFLSESPHGSVFTDIGFLNSLEVPYELIGVKRGCQLLAGCVVPVLKDYAQPTSESLPFSMYQGILLHQSVSGGVSTDAARGSAATKALLDTIFFEYRYGYFSQHWSFIDHRPFQWFNFDRKSELLTTRVGHTAIIEFASDFDFESYLLGISTSRREEWRKGQQLLSFTRGTERDLSTLLTLYEQTFEQQGKEVSSKDLKKVIDISRGGFAGSYASLGVSYYEEVPVSAALFLTYKNVAYYLLGANSRLSREMGGSTFVILNMIRGLLEHGINSLDLCGANSPGRGAFKLSLGAELKSYMNHKISHRDQ